MAGGLRNRPDYRLILGGFNVFEWCLDTYRAYPGGTAYSDSGTMKIFRGGAY